MLKARLDHLVLTVADLARTRQFYETVLGLRAEEFLPGRWALAYEGGKLNLHVAGHEFEPKAAHPVPGSADLCFLVDEPVEEIMTSLEKAGIPVELGPIRRTGSQGPIWSIYLRDPDQNLIEISNSLNG